MLRQMPCPIHLILPFKLLTLNLSSILIIWFHQLPYCFKRFLGSLLFLNPVRGICSSGDPHQNLLGTLAFTNIWIFSLATAGGPLYLVMSKILLRHATCMLETRCPLNPHCFQCPLNLHCNGLCYPLAFFLHSYLLLVYGGVV